MLALGKSTKQIENLTKNGPPANQSWKTPETLKQKWHKMTKNGMLKITFIKAL